MRAIRPDEAARRRTHKPEEISWQCTDLIKKAQLAAGDTLKRLLIILFKFLNN